MKGDFSRQRRSPAGSMPSVRLIRLRPLSLRDPPEGWRLLNGSCDASEQSRRIKTRLSLSRAPRHAAMVLGRREEETRAPKEAEGKDRWQKEGRWWSKGARFKPQQEVERLLILLSG